MKIYAVNGSPRKKGNTATLLHSALEGAASVTGQEQVTTECINLYEYTFKPCISCFQCKRLNGKSYGQCAVNDSLTPILEKLKEADGIIFGSPIYFGGITAQLRGLFERLLFQYVEYTENYTTIAPKKMPTAFIYTMNVTEEVMQAQQYAAHLKTIELATGRVFMPPQIMYCYNTYQFDDYTKYNAPRFPEPEKALQRQNVFPLDMQKAFALGKDMVSANR